jgi:dCMP deaminase
LISNAKINKLASRIVNMDMNGLDIEVSTDAKYKKLLKECYEYSKNGEHPLTHTAALLVKDIKIILKGANMFPSGVNKKKDRLTKGNRGIYINHAERDLVYKAAREGVKTNGLMMVMPWLPCIACANAVISSGIKTLVVHKQMIERTREGWQEELKNAVKIMEEAGIKIIAYDGVVGAKAYMHSEEWDA